MNVPERFERQARNEALFREVRAQDDRFVVKPGHETPEIERAIEWTYAYVVVDKIPAAEPFVADDPRGAPSS